MNSNLKRIGRWIAVLPVAIVMLLIAQLASNIIFGIQMWFMGMNFGSGFWKISYWILSSAIGSGAGVYFGAKTAPSYRKIVSMVLAALLTAFVTLNIVLAFTTGTDVIWVVLASVSSVIAAGYIVYGFFEEGENFSIS